MNPDDIVLRTLVVNSNNHLQRHLQKFIVADKRIELIRYLKNGRQMVNYLRNNEDIDLVIVNPELPDTSAFEAFQLTPKDRLPLIVMVSERHEYAYFAYQMDVTDFLDMIFTRPEYEHSIKKVQRELVKRRLFQNWSETASEEE